MTGQFAGQVALVTGAGGGMGRAIALAFAAEGARVAVCDLKPAVDETAGLIGDLGSEAIAARVDVSDAAAVDAFVDNVVAHWGRLDAACNSAGIYLERSDLPWGDAEVVDRSLSVNCQGVLHAMVAQLRHMTAAGRGAIVNIASVASFSGKWGAGYTASKHAVVGLTRSAAIHYAAQGIRINCVCPGLIETELTRPYFVDDSARAALAARHPMNRIGLVEEVAQPVLFLLSEKASFITGHALMVDGGVCAA